MAILDWGIDVVLWFQQFSPALDVPFIFLTSLGSQEFFMLMLPLVYWCIDRDAGSRLIVFFLISTYLNQVAKVLLDQPRPFDYDPRARQLVHESGGGLPSGHTQGAVVVWGFIAAHWKRPWVWGLAAALMIGVPLSRVYLGVHFPTDLLGGYLIGAILLWLYFGMAPSLTKWLGHWPLALQLLLAVVLPLALVSVYPGSDGYGVMISATLTGLAIGLALERRFVRFKVGGRWWQRASAYGLGVVMLFGIYYGLRVLFSGLEPTVFWRFGRYVLVGLWGTLGAPWVFVKLKLVPADN